MADEFIRVWLTFSLMILAAAVLAAVWAARAGHFRGQERARRLALWAQVAEEEGSPLSLRERGRGEGEDVSELPSPGLRPPSPGGRGDS